MNNLSVRFRSVGLHTPLRECTVQGHSERSKPQKSQTIAAQLAKGFVSRSEDGPPTNEARPARREAERRKAACSKGFEASSRRNPAPLIWLSRGRLSVVLLALPFFAKWGTERPA